MNDPRERWRVWSARLLLAAWLMILSLPYTAEAGDAALSWTNPTSQEACTDAGPLPNLAGTRIYRLVAEIADPAAQSWTDTGLLPGTYQYVATSYTEDGANSRLSGTTTKEVTTFVAPAGAFAYGISQTRDIIVLQPVGTLRAETACSTAMSVNGRYRVPRDAVDWIGSLRPEVVFAECG